MGSLYGAAVAGGYLWLKSIGGGGLSLFVVSCALLFLIHLIYSYFWSTLTDLNAAIILRGVFFGMTQFCIIKAQLDHTTSSTLFSAVVGSLTGSLAGHAIIGERLGRVGGISLALCIVGAIVAVSPKSSSINYLAVFGGLLQGLTALVTRSIARQNVSHNTSLTVGFFFGTAIGGIGIFATDSVSEISTLSIPQILVGSLAIFFIQHFFFLLYRFVDMQKATVMSLTRIPWSHLFEWLVFRIPPTYAAIAGSALVVVGASIAVLKQGERNDAK